MWVLKLGGSLNDSPALAQWLELVDRFGSGRVALVCGGGGFADEARRLHSLWKTEELPAHNMAVLAMVQTAYLAQAINPRLVLVASVAELDGVMRSGKTAVWMPFDRLSNSPHDEANWDVTGDSIALELARRLNAERLVVVKSCVVPEAATVAELGQAGVLDKRFAQLAQGVSFPIDVVQRDDIGRVKGWLHR
jgi:5-(aminomethyl)-3-furanmethanol phosphate kinase